jgi:hypothetical protein
VESKKDKASVECGCWAVGSHREPGLLDIIVAFVSIS